MIDDVSRQDGDDAASPVADRPPRACGVGPRCQCSPRSTRTSRAKRSTSARPTPTSSCRPPSRASNGTLPVTDASLATQRTPGRPLPVAGWTARRINTRCDAEHRYAGLPADSVLPAVDWKSSSAARGSGPGTAHASRDDGLGRGEPPLGLPRRGARQRHRPVPGSPSGPVSTRSSPACT